MTDGLRIAAVTAHRSHEVAEPLSLADGTVELVDIDASDGFLERNLNTVVRLLELTSDPKPDAVLSDCLGLLGFLIAAICVLRGVPFVFRFKGNHWQGLEEIYRTGKDDGLGTKLRYYLTYALDEAIYRSARGYVVVSAELKEVVVERTGCRPEQVHVVHVPLVPDREDGSARAARERFGIEEETVLLTVTNLKYRGKYDGVRTIVEGMESVLASHDDVAYVVAGGGSYLEDVRAAVDAIADPAVRDRIYALGFVENVADLYALADAFVYVSHIDGYPRSVLEAQQSALPAMVNAAHGMVEQVEDGETGVVLEEATAEQVAAQVTRLLDDDGRARLGENARMRVRTENDPEAIGHQLVAAIDAIVGGR
ncbi:group 1 glycosyl transferase [Halogeometricum pallidum JCM 14848]|uniref:Group 1 glycosyl transferase n=1 Tax=Halogeometricum pallidum JCM 14848 TaxID=1227487 RepID=M0DD78_HALPD|nr:glycosyltransferase family 4 protein [Halogeometricum pallidum]ELZ33431.1 group 1 glycosyl transferase [Halogeometricum pallidum JCM 14848]